MDGLWFQVERIRAAWMDGWIDGWMNGWIFVCYVDEVRARERERERCYIRSFPWLGMGINTVRFLEQELLFWIVLCNQWHKIGPDHPI